MVVPVQWGENQQRQRGMFGIRIQSAGRLSSWTDLPTQNLPNSLWTQTANNELASAYSESFHGIHYRTRFHFFIQVF